MPNHAVKRDATHTEIVRALRQVGALVWEIEKEIDALVWFRGQMYLADFKAGRHWQLTATQKQMMAEGWPIKFWTTRDEALREIGATQ